MLWQRKLRGLIVRVRAVAALLLFFFQHVLALVSLSFQVSFLNQESLVVLSPGAAVHRPGGISPLPIGSMLVPLPGGRRAAVNWTRGTVRQAALPSVRRGAASTEPGGGSRLRSSSGASSVRLRSLPFEFMFDTLAVDCADLSS